MGMPLGALIARNGGEPLIIGDHELSELRDMEVTVERSVEGRTWRVAAHRRIDLQGGQT
jgi:hypothetical protein